MNVATRKKFKKIIYGYIYNMKHGEGEKTSRRIVQDIRLYTLSKDEEIEILTKRIFRLKELSKNIIKKYNSRELCDRDIEDFHSDIVKGEKEVWKSVHMEKGELK